MNANDRGQNLADNWPVVPAHGGYPDARCACAGTGWIAERSAVIPCPEHAARPAPAPVPEPPAIDWEAVAGRALADLQAARNEIKRLRAGDA